MRTVQAVAAITFLAAPLACSEKQPSGTPSSESAGAEADGSHSYALCDAESADVTVLLRLQVDGVCDNRHDFHFRKLMVDEREAPTRAHTIGYTTHGDGTGFCHGTRVFFLRDTGPTLEFSVSVDWTGRDGDKGDVTSTLEVAKGRDAEIELAPGAKVLWEWANPHNQRVQTNGARRSDGRDD